MEELGLIHSILSHKASWLIRGGRQCEALALNAYLTHTLGWWQRKVGYTMCFQLPAGERWCCATCDADPGKDCNPWGVCTEL